jgi:hypothetical protein
MIITVQGKLINTEFIYLICKINKWQVKSEIVLGFVIEFLNEKSIEVHHSFTVNAKWVQGKGHVIIERDKYYASDEYKSELKKITDLRDKIVKIWSENQSEIPKLEIEKDDERNTKEI